MGKTDTPAATRRGKGRPARDQTRVGRDAVVAAASAFLKRHPLGDATRAKFSREAGIDPSLVRYYFGNIASLLTEGMHDMFIDLQSRRATVAPEASFRIQLRERIGGVIDVLEANPHLHQLVMAPVFHIEPSKAEEVERLRREYTMDSVNSLQSSLSTAREHGEIVETDISLFYIVLLGICDFVTRCYQYFDILSIPPGTREEMLSRYADYAADLLMDGLRPR